ncbi:hypothetical protein H4R24_005070 [Coemansia sp. RSA 988]|nr:hypothetical protein H4R24_005070 [Coemansia sp. RSA 988]
MNSWLSELVVLLKRDWIMTMRNKSFVWGMAADCLAMMLFVGFVFFQLKNDQESIQNRIGTLFFMTLMDIYPVIIPAMIIIMIGRTIMFRERSSGMYRMTTYFIARSLSFMPVIFIPNMIKYIGIYFISHLQYQADKFFIHMALHLVLLFCAIGYAFMMAMIVNRIDIAASIAPVSLACLILFAGNLANVNSITPVLRWIKYVCIVFYSYAGLVQNEFDGLEFTCTSENTSCYKNGAEVIEFYGVGIVPIWATVAAPLPELTQEYIKQMYPSYLNLIQAQVLFRHGERAPMMSKLFPDEKWLFCSETNRLHSEFMKAVNLFEPLGKKVTIKTSGSASDGKIDYEPAFWSIRMVEKPAQKANPDEAWDPRSCHMGQLTDLGLNSLHHSGAFLRALYVDKLKFIPQTPKGNLNDWLYIRTTDYSRVIQSTYALLTGMFPGYPKQKDKSNLGVYSWPEFGKGFLQQFPIHTRDLFKDPLNFASRGPGYLALLNGVTIEESRKVKWLDDIYRQTIQIPSIGAKAKELMNHEALASNFHHLFDELMSSKAHGIPLPFGMSSEHMDNIHAASYHQWMTIPQTTNGQRMGYGELVSNIAQTMAQAASAADSSTGDWPRIGSQRTHDLLLSHDGGLRETSDHEVPRVPRMALYGTHDVTIGSLATILGSTRKRWPMFGSLMTIELFKDTTTPLEEVQRNLPTPSTLEQQPPTTDGYFVRVLLDKEAIKLPTCQMQGKHHPKMGTSVCSLAAFYEHIEAIVE